MTDRRRDALRRDADGLTIGPSSLDWDGETLTVRIEEVTAPIPSRLKGVVRLRPQALHTRRFTLDSDGRHTWQPIAPRSRVEVELESPALRWSGAAYFDTNAGDAPLEQDFRGWDWCRAALPDATAILYNAQRRGGSEISIAVRATDDGALTDFTPPPAVDLPRTLWRLVAAGALAVVQLSPRRRGFTEQELARSVAERTVRACPSGSTVTRVAGASAFAAADAKLERLCRPARAASRPRRGMPSSSAASSTRSTSAAGRVVPFPKRSPG
jgi:carotenoid 1,2-hydratase